MYGKGTGELDTVTITFNSNYEATETKQMSVEKNKDINLAKNSFKREGYDFIEWNTNPDGTGTKYEDGANININKDTTLYAIWKKHVEFSMAYGRIEVVWLDTNDNVIPKPNTPNLGNMTPVKWNGFTELDTTASDSEWYNYKAKEGTEDNLDSHWANAKNRVNDIDSYFVWIPRYAYRITYYASNTSDEVTGYCDPNGIQDIYGNVQRTIRKYSKIS